PGGEAPGLQGRDAAGVADVPDGQLEQHGRDGGAGQRAEPHPGLVPGAGPSVLRRSGRPRPAAQTVGGVAVEPLHRAVAVADGVAHVERGQPVRPVRLRAVLQVQGGHDQQHDLQQRLAQQQRQAGARHLQQVAEGQAGRQQHPEADLAGGDQGDDHVSLLSVTLPGSRPRRPGASSPTTNSRYIERCSPGPSPGTGHRRRAAGWMVPWPCDCPDRPGSTRGSRSRGARAACRWGASAWASARPRPRRCPSAARSVLDGAMAVRLSRPPRFDAWIALAGLAGGLLLWGFGLGVRPPEDPMVLFGGRWPLLVPLAVTACCELLRRTAPRTALLIGTAALAADTMTQGSIATIVMYTDLMYAAVVYGTPATARRLPKITGVLTVAATLVPYAGWRVPEALLIGLVVGAVTFAPAST